MVFIKRFHYRMHLQHVEGYHFTVQYIGLLCSVLCSPPNCKLIDDEIYNMIFTSTLLCLMTARMLIRVVFRARVKTLHARVKFKLCCIYVRGNAPDKRKNMFARGRVKC